tara:strand:+ start:236 stop:505 length:270 start_codon:yes stop_codon:yes gene_type:complete
MDKFNDELNVPLLSPTERVAITFDYISTFIAKCEKLCDKELLILESKILYYLNWVDDKVLASFLRSVVHHLQNLRRDRKADEEGITPTT